MKIQRFGRWRWLGPLPVCFALLANTATGFGACQQMSVSASYFSSWDNYGIENRIRVQESNRPDSVAGRGPSYDRRIPNALRLSENVLAFYLPTFTGTVVNAELRLRIRYLVSFRGSEIYQWHSLDNPRVKLAVHRIFLSNVYDDPDPRVYGAAPVTLADSEVSIPLNSDLIGQVTAGAGKWFLMQGSLATLGGDPLNQQYLYLDTSVGNYATLVLTLDDTNALQIATQPVDRSVAEDTEAEFHVVACGQPPVSYQWRLGLANVAGATNASLLLPNVSASHAGPYSVVVSNSSGAVTSAVAQLAVNQVPPYFALQPYGLGLAAEDSGLLRGFAGGAPVPVYQWRFNGTNLPGATSNVLRLDFVTPQSAGTYTLVASNSSGSVTSNPALVTVVPFFLYSYGGGINAWLDNPVYLYSSYYGHAPPDQLQWYRHYTDPHGESWSEAVPGGTELNLTFTATPATAGEYFLIGQNQYGAVTSSVFTVTVQAIAPVFTQVLTPRTLIAGVPATFYVTAYAGPPPVFFWDRDGVPIANGNGPELSFPSFLPSDAGNYRVVASNQLGQVASGPVTMSVIPCSVFINPSGTSIGEGSPLVFRAYYQGVPEVSFQWRLNGQVLPGETNSVLFLPYVLGSHAGDYTVSASNIYGGVVSFPSHLAVGQSPAVAYLPSLVSKRVGDFAWLTAYVYGSPPPSCQWQFNGVDIPGATNYVLPLSNLSTQQSGLYSVTVSNGVPPTITNTQTLFLEITARGPLDDWTFLNPRPQANPLRAVAVGNGRRLAVGENGAALISTDGQTWAAHYLGKGIHLKAVTYGNGTFVAAGNVEVPEYRGRVIFTSPDGVTWTARPVTAEGDITGLAFGNGLFVALGTSVYPFSDFSLVFTSTDGIAWQKYFLGGNLTAASLSAVTFGNGRFVAVSDGGLASGIISSTDGVNWTQARGAENHNFEGVCEGNGTFVAVGDYSVIARSSDGLNWTLGSISNTSAQLKGVAFGDGAFVAVSDFGRIFKSSDGAFWGGIASPSAHDLGAIAFGNGQFTAVGDAGRILVSTNGQDWADQCVGPDLDLYALAKGPAGYVAVGEGGIQFSPDRVNWTVISVTRKLHHVLYANGLYVAVGKKGLILTSPDGLNWTERASGVSEYIEHVVWGNNRFVAVGEKGLMTTSIDGLNWSVVPPATPADIEDMTYANGIFVGVGGYFDVFGAITTVITSTNGLDWKDQYTVAFFGTRARGVTFGGGRFVLVGNDGLSAVSTNGQLWEDSFHAQDNFRSVAYSSGRFIAVGNDGLIMSSPDGIYWANHGCIASMNLRDVQVDDDGLVAIGSNGTLLKSSILQPQLLARRNGSGFELDVWGGLSPQYQLQSSTDFRHWNNVMSYSNSAPVQYLDTSGAPVQFYRLVPVP